MARAALTRNPPPSSRNASRNAPGSPDVTRGHRHHPGRAGVVCVLGRATVSWLAVDSDEESASGVGQATLSEADSGQGIERRLQRFAYLQPGRNHRTYLAIMRLFTSTLLADLSAGEVASALAKAERDGQIDPGESQIEVVLPRLRQLLDWGNLVLGRREAVAT